MPVFEPDVATIIARTAKSYDALPYGSDPFPFTHPSQVGAVARLFGLEAAPPGEARILELGCASGGNIIPMAARHPGATIVGVDLSGAQVAAGRARIAVLGLAAHFAARCWWRASARRRSTAASPMPGWRACMSSAATR